MGNAYTSIADGSARGAVKAEVKVADRTGRSGERNVHTSRKIVRYNYWRISVADYHIIARRRRRRRCWRRAWCRGDTRARRWYRAAIGRFKSDVINREVGCSTTRGIVIFEPDDVRASIGHTRRQTNASLSVCSLGCRWFGNCLNRCSVDLHDEGCVKRSIYRTNPHPVFERRIRSYRHGQRLLKRTNLSRCRSAKPGIESTGSRIRRSASGAAERSTTKR